MQSVRTSKYVQLAPLVCLGMVLIISSARAQSAGKGSAALSLTRVGVVDPATDLANSQGASWVDYDGDGDLDLFVANIGGANFLYQNDGEGHLTRVTSGTLATDQLASRGVCWADYDNDDDLDVFVSGNASAMYVNDGLGEFTVADPMATFGTTDLRGWACAWADYDLDGYVDLVVTHPAGFSGNPVLSNQLFLNRGDGTMERITNSPITMGFAPYTVATWSDYDLDGDPDLFIGAGPATGTPGPDFAYHNMMVETGTASFVRITDGPLVTTNRDGQVFNWIDYDNDGDLDVYITNWGGSGLGGLRDELYRNDEGTLTQVTTGSIVTDKQVSLASVWADFDNDGDLDAFVTDGNLGVTNRLYGNNGDGTFTRIIVGDVIDDRSVSWGATAGDYDNDGDLDLFIANATNGSANFLYRNDLEPGNHWLKVRAVGTMSNRAGIGALVRVKATVSGVATWMMREVSSQNSFNGHNDLTLHFGLGDAAVIDSLVISWPSGAQDLYEVVEADQTIVATEGESPTAIATEDDQPPAKLQLLGNYPNPVVGTTRLVFTQPGTQSVTVAVFDVLGRLVAKPVDEVLGPGHHEAQLNMRGLPDGPYVYRLSAGGREYQGVLVVVR